VTVSINVPNGTTMHVGNSQQLTVTTNAADPSVNWASSNPSWCDVGIQTGVLTARGTGTCTIYATLKNNPTLATYGQQQITVIP
jgi:uncharacterized protein YjdB